MIHYCPICKAKVEFIGNKWRPFCSERCKLIDLGEWASEKYGIPGEEQKEEEEKKEEKEEPKKSSSGSPQRPKE